MRAKKWMAFALALAVAGSGTGILAHAMTKDQSRTAARTVAVADEAEPPAKEKEAEGADGQSYKIEMAKESKYDKIVERTAADITPEEAVRRAVDKVGETFGKYTVKKVVDVDLQTFTSRDKKRKNYNGVILCKEDCAFNFGVETVTGDVVYLQKVWNFQFDGYTSVEGCEKKTQEVRKEGDRYKKAAIEYLEKTVKAGKVKRASVDMGSMGVTTPSYYSSSAALHRLNSSGSSCYKYENLLAVAELKLVDGNTYWVWMEENDDLEINVICWELR